MRLIRSAIVRQASDFPEVDVGVAFTSNYAVSVQWVAAADQVSVRVINNSEVHNH